MKNDKKEPVTKRNYYLIEQGKTPYHVTESFRKIKAALSVSVPKHGKGGISIAFTSSYPEEGKTTVSVNLAATFAMSSNHKIVIVDTDIRKGLISKYFKQKSKPGLSEYLSGVATLDEVVKPSGVIENLSFIPCGSRSPKPYELLESDAMKELDKKLREEYDYVIYDTAPLLLFADSVAVGQICDGVAVVCRHMVSYENELEKTLNTLKFANVNILGVIVNDFKLNEQLVGGSRHSKYYESGYEYYSTEDK
jgi:tyrosine-protein kinase Etk/Wzc